ncbi:MFS transporter [Kiloniella laminariae]|uniref:MFS transporter n=1 Tax=Kiloniella laminariae TaxID=454162 RepID=UPI00036D28B3|nr:MFS transporter [Kiloniella laminariae]
MFVRHPVWLQNATRPGSETFALVFAAESLSRSIISSVIPIQLLRVLGDSQQVSVLYFTASCVGMIFALFLPMIVGIIPRRWVYTFGAVGFIVAAFFLMTEDETSLVIGMIARVVGLVSTTICMNLYILDFIARRDLSRSEPTRIFYSALSWSIGPVCGALLMQWWGMWAPFAVSACCAAVMLGYFWCLRLGGGLVITAGSRRPAPNPLSSIRQFIRQPRLNMAWIIAFCRASWWSMFFIYTPIYAVESGLGEIIGGLIVSAGNACLFLLPIWARIARRIGARKVLMIAFIVAGTGTSLVAFLNGYAYLGVGLLLIAALGMSFQDAIGNLPFMVAVRPRERSEMTSVFMTYRDASELVPPGIYALLLRSFDLSAVFLATGALMFGIVGIAARVHPRVGKDRVIDKIAAPAE